MPDSSLVHRDDCVPGCEHVHAPDFYADALLNEWVSPGMREHLRRQMERSEGIYLVQHAQGCPVLQRAIEHGRKLAEEHGW